MVFAVELRHSFRDVKNQAKREKQTNQFTIVDEERTIMIGGI